MADLDETEKCATEDELNQRHKQERKKLQGEIQKLKHSVSKGDKKKKKEVNEKVAVLESDLDAKHEKERAEFEQGQNEHKTSGALSAVCEGLQQMTTEEPAGETGDQQMTNEALVSETGDQQMTNEALVGETGDQQSSKKKKPSKAQKRREKKVAQYQEREDRIKDQEVDNLTSSRHLENLAIKQTLGQRGLQPHQIPSDGNCLYAAVAHQLELRNIESSTESLRRQVAGYMRTHPDDFMPFLTKDSGDCYTQEDFEEYCHQTETTPAWGGQLEIQALTTVLRIPIEVVQADGPPLITGQQYKENKPVTLTYYRHAFGLGEHYNSVADKKEDSGDEFT